MSVAHFRLISTDAPKRTAIYAVAGDFTAVQDGLRGLIGKSVYAMGQEPAVGRVIKAEADDEDARVVIALSDSVTLAKVAASVLSCGQCRLDKNGRLGSFNIVDSPLERDSLRKGAGLSRSTAYPVAQVQAALAKARNGGRAAPAGTDDLLKRCGDLTRKLNDDLQKLIDGDGDMPGIEARLDALKAAHAAYGRVQAENYHARLAQFQPPYRDGGRA